MHVNEKDFLQIQKNGEYLEAPIIPGNTLSQGIKFPSMKALDIALDPIEPLLTDDEVRRIENHFIFLTNYTMEDAYTAQDAMEVIKKELKDGRYEEVMESFEKIIPYLSLDILDDEKYYGSLLRDGTLSISEIAAIKGNNK